MSLGKSQLFGFIFFNFFLFFVRGVLVSIESGWKIQLFFLFFFICFYFFYFCSFWMYWFVFGGLNDNVVNVLGLVSTL